MYELSKSHHPFLCFFQLTFFKDWFVDWFLALSSSRKAMITFVSFVIGSDCLFVVASDIFFVGFWNFFDYLGWFFMYRIYLEAIVDNELDWAFKMPQKVVHYLWILTFWGDFSCVFGLLEVKLFHLVDSVFELSEERFHLKSVDVLFFFLLYISILPVIFIFMSGHRQLLKRHISHMTHFHFIFLKWRRCSKTDLRLSHFLSKL